MSDEKIILTPDEAESLLLEGEYVHNYSNPAGMLLGCDYGREDAIAELRKAHAIELGGDGSKSIKHPIVCWHTEKRHTFFEADMEKVEAFEAARSAAVS
jgi:hypothetical protein